MKEKQQISIIVTRFRETDETVKKCLASLSQQIDVLASVFFLDQQESPELKKYITSLPQKNITISYLTIPAKSLSFARNYGLKAAQTHLVAFTDADCVLQKNWASEIVKTFEKTNAVVVGTKILPHWEATPTWYHRSKYIKEFYSLLDVSQKVCEIAKVIGASFAVDTSQLPKEMYFDESLGRKNGNYLGGEETDLCQRVKNKGKKIFYTPNTQAFHQVSETRMNSKWLFTRAYYGGLSRAYRGGKSEPFNTSYDFVDRLAILYILPAYAAGLLYGKLKKRNETDN